MNLSEVKNKLQRIDELLFQLPNGELVPEHFHVTEVGSIEKTFIDCGGVIRSEKKVSLQLWSAEDYNHRLHPEKLIEIIELSEHKLNIQDAEVEVEYQAETIGTYGLDFSDGRFHLTTKQTDCLAKDECDIPEKKPKINLSELQTTSSCNPDSGCC